MASAQASEYALRVQQILEQRLSTSDVEEIERLPAPDQAVDYLLELRAHDRGPNRLAEAVGPFWTSETVMRTLGIPTRQALHSRIRSGSLLAVKTSDGKLLFPLSQFVRTRGAVLVKPGLQTVFRILRQEDPWAVALLLHAPAQELQGHTPLEWVAATGPDVALEELARNTYDEWNRP